MRKASIPITEDQVKDTLQTVCDQRRVSQYKSSLHKDSAHTQDETETRKINEDLNLSCEED